MLGTDKPECESYWAIDDPSRQRNFKSGQNKNDYHLAEGWYRFITGKQMSTSCILGSGYCDADNQGSLQGSHPSVEDGMVTRKVCFSYYQPARRRHGYSSYYQQSVSECCKYSTFIKVRNCGSFYVYKLKPTANNSCRYCTEY